MLENAVVVIIAAYNAADTIEAALCSALAHNEVSEVIVVDDASTDNTVRIATKTANGDSRVRIIVRDENKGPSSARNLAISESTSPLIAILDADDIILPGRFRKLLSTKDWDLVADNIIFCSNFTELDDLKRFEAMQEGLNELSVSLTLKQFITGNITKRGRQRGELGFIKPIIRRSFLEKYNINYEEDCRLGEDFLLYSSCLMKKARLKIIGSCGYAALIRPNSLSGGHSLADLNKLWSHSQSLAEKIPKTLEEKSAMNQFSFSILRRMKHREVLEIRHKRGLLAGLFAVLSRPTTTIDILNDKLANQTVRTKTPRYLFTKKDLGKYGI